MLFRSQGSMANVRMERLTYSVAHSVCRGVCLMMTPRSIADSSKSDATQSTGYVDDDDVAAYIQTLEATRQCMLELLQQHHTEPSKNTM